MTTETRGVYLVADAAGSTRDTGVLPVGVPSGQVRVGRTLLAPVGVPVDVETGGTGNAVGPGPRGVLRDQGAGAARRRHTVQDVGHADGVELHHVTDVPTHLHTQTQDRNIRVD